MDAIIWRKPGLKRFRLLHVIKSHKQTSIAYTPTTTLGLDLGWDGTALSDGDIAIYSLAGDGKFGIQARPAFDPADVVPIDYKVTTAGQLYYFIRSL